MIRYIEYGDYTIGYEIEGDVDGAHAIIERVWLQNKPIDTIIFDEDDIKDIKFHCEEDYRQRVWDTYMRTGETI